jgi:AraC-like DNA-binding protein/mannose-6-phosphate isomerase-like protein (cupin superfamily)
LVLKSNKKIPWQEKEEFGFSLPFRCWDSALPEFVFPPHWHEYYELFVVLEGKVKVVVDGAERDALCGDILSIKPGQVHGFPHSERGTRLRFFQFEAEIFSKDAGIIEGGAIFTRKAVLQGAGHPERSASADALCARVYGLLSDMFTEYREQKKGYRLAIRSALYQMALVYLRDEQPHNNPAVFSPPPVKQQASFVTEKRIEQIYQLIFSNYNDIDFDMDRAARAAALSPSYLAHSFKEQTGHSFYSYLSRVRISHAVEFLLKTDLPISLIAYKCGFSSLPTFHRMFKAETGCTPVTYRKNAKQQ